LGSDAGHTRSGKRRAHHASHGLTDWLISQHGFAGWQGRDGRRTSLCVVQIGVMQWFGRSEWRCSIHVVAGSITCGGWGPGRALSAHKHTQVPQPAPAATTCAGGHNLRPQPPAVPAAARRARGAAPGSPGAIPDTPRSLGPMGAACVSDIVIDGHPERSGYEAQPPAAQQ
jgi:hypothetical protein